MQRLGGEVATQVSLAARVPHEATLQQVRPGPCLPRTARTGTGLQPAYFPAAQRKSPVPEHWTTYPSSGVSSTDPRLTSSKRRDVKTASSRWTGPHLLSRPGAVAVCPINRTNHGGRAMTYRKL